MIVVDSHIHLGMCRVFEAEIRQEELLKAMRENNLENFYFERKQASLSLSST